MAEYIIMFARSARKELERLSADVVGRIFPRIEALAQNPRPPGCRKLRGAENLWRIREEVSEAYEVTLEQVRACLTFAAQMLA